MKPTIRNWITGLFVLTALAGLFGLARGTAEAQKADPLPAGQSIDDVQIQELRDLLNGGQLSAVGRESVQAKLAMAERMAAERQEVQQAVPAGPRAKVLPEALQLAPLAAEQQPVPEGIFAGSEGLIRPSLATIENMWQGQVGGSLFQVFAGSLPDDPQQGLLIVVQVGEGRPTGDQHVYLAEQEVGALRIAAVEGALLLLEGASGQIISFDLLTRTYQK